MLRRELSPVLVNNVQQFVIDTIQQGGAGRIDELVVLVHVDPGPRGPGHLLPGN